MGYAPALAVLALCAALTGCGKGSPAELPPAAAAAVILATPSANPAGFYDIPYDHYEEAALQTGIAPSAVMREEGFSAGLADLCDNSQGDFESQLAGMRSDASSADDPANTLNQRLNEVDLRISLACQRRMTDWLAARGILDPSDDPNPTDDDSAGYAEAPPEGDEPTDTPEPDPVDGGDAGGEETDSGDPAETGISSVHVDDEETGSGTDASDEGDSGDSDTASSSETASPSSDAAYHDTSGWE